MALTDDAVISLIVTLLQNGVCRSICENGQKGSKTRITLLGQA